MHTRYSLDANPDQNQNQNRMGKVKVGKSIRQDPYFRLYLIGSNYDHKTDILKKGSRTCNIGLCSIAASLFAFDQ